MGKVWGSCARLSKSRLEKDMQTAHDALHCLLLGASVNEKPVKLEEPAAAKPKGRSKVKARKAPVAPEPQCYQATSEFTC